MLGRLIALVSLLVVGGVGVLASPASADPHHRRHGWRHRGHHGGHGGGSFFGLGLDTPWGSLSFGRGRSGFGYGPGYGGYNPYDWGYTGPFYTGRGYSSDYFVPPPGIRGGSCCPW